MENKGFTSIGLRCCGILAEKEHIIFARGQNNKTAVSQLDAVPERRIRALFRSGRIERFSPRFRPDCHFSHLSFTYLSPGNEGEKW